MKRLFIIAFSLLLGLNVLAENKNLSAIFSYATFNLTNGSPYVETYISFDAWTLNFVKGNDNLYRATVEITLSAAKADSIVFAKKYELNSPAITDPEEGRFPFIDLQRFALDNGIYDLSISVRDKASQNAPLTITEKLAVYYPSKKPCLSTLQPMTSAFPTEKENKLSRGGYDMEPYVSDFYPEQVNVINSYCEIYNISDEIFDKEFLTMVYVEQKETLHPIESTRTMRTHTGAKLVPVYSSIDIRQLPSGNYNLVFEVRNTKNEVMLFTKVPFIRSNPNVENTITQVAATFAGRINDEKTLNYYLSALYPIAIAKEQAQADELAHTPGRIQEKQEFFYQFWLTRDQMDPEAAWREYRERLEFVDANFSQMNQQGFRTDRGRVYLQYGKPDFVRDEKNFASIRHLNRGTKGESSNTSSMVSTGLGSRTRPANNQSQVFYLPYQLWRYNEIPGDDVNRCFIFWDEFRAGTYRLLHSNAKGEVRDPLWERRLSSQQIGEGDVGAVGEQFERGY